MPFNYSHFNDKNTRSFLNNFYSKLGTTTFNMSKYITNPQGGITPPPVVTYYVDPSGSDTNDGLTQATAWQTISKVNNSTIPAGAHVLFKGGASFTGELSLVSGKHFGTVSGQPTVFGSYGVGKATILADSNAANGISAYNPQHLTIQDIICIGTGTTVSNSTGVKVESNIGGGIKHSGVSLLRLEVSQFGIDGISAYSTHPTEVSGFNGLLIDGCVAHDNTGNTITNYGCGITIQGKYGLLTYPIAHTAPIVRNCIAYNNTGKLGLGNGSGNGIMIAQCENALIEWCQAYNNGANNNFPGSGPVGIWFYDNWNSVIQFCESHHNLTQSGDGGGFDIDGGCQNCTIQYCYSHDNGGPGYMLYHFTDPGYMLPFFGNVLRYNITENDNTYSSQTFKGSINIGTASTTETAPNCHVYGNTIYQSIASKAGIYFISNQNMFTNGRISNNIIYVTGASSKFIDSFSTTNPVMTFTGNLYYSGAQPVSIKWGATTYDSIAAWRAARTTQETIAGIDTSVSGDPLFQGTLPIGTIGGFNTTLLAPYRTQTTSPTINAGKDLLALSGINMGSSDLFGNSIPRGSVYDIGVFDAVGTPITPPSNTTAPSVSGLLTQGSILTTTLGTWTNSPTTYYFQWKRNGTSISGAKSSTYTTVLADVGAMISCDVTAANKGGAATQSSNSIGPVVIPASFVFTDNFNRANDASSLIIGNSAWTTSGGSSTSARVTSNQLQVLTTEGGYLTPDLLSANHAVQALVVAAAATTGPFLAVRMVDQNNFVGIRFSTSTGGVQLWQRVEGTLTQIGSATIATGAGHTIRVEVYDDKVQVLRNGVVIIAPYTLIGLGAGITKAGIIARTTAINPWIDDFHAENILSLTV